MINKMQNGGLREKKEKKKKKEKERTSEVLQHQGKKHAYLVINKREV